MDTPEELIEPFATAVSMTLREMAGVEAVVRDRLKATGTEKYADLSIELRLTARSEGRLVMSFPMQTAAELTGRVLREAGCIADDTVIRDCVGELTNVIAGQAKTLLYGTAHHFTLSTPRVLPAEFNEVAAGRWIIRFDSDAGAFDLYLWLPS